HTRITEHRVIKEPQNIYLSVFENYSTQLFRVLITKKRIRSDVPEHSSVSCDGKSALDEQMVRVDLVFCGLISLRQILENWPLIALERARREDFQSQRRSPRLSSCLGTPCASRRR